MQETIQSRGLGGLKQRIFAIEKKDRELWLLALCSLGILAAGLFFVLVPALLMGQESFYVSAELTPQLLVGLLVLVSLLISLLAQRRVQMRRLRLTAVVEEWDAQLVSAHMLLDP